MGTLVGASSTCQPLRRPLHGLARGPCEGAPVCHGWPAKPCRPRATSGYRPCLALVRGSDNTAASTRDKVVAEPSPSNGVSSSEPSSNGSSSTELDPAGLLATLASELEEEEEDGELPAGGATSWVASLGVLGGVLLLMGGGYLFRDPIKAFLGFFVDAVDEWGYLGYLAYAAVYTGLEVLAVPAIPLTMTAGVIFGPIAGTAIVSASATLAATIAFLIARYAARDKVAAFARKNKRFAAVDRAISKSGFKFVVLLRLSPLLPLAASNYLYGLTSVDLGRYVLGSWLGMLPGTYAYVTAGHVGKAVLTEGEGAISFDSWHIGLALGATLLALGFVGQLAKKAVEEADAEAVAEQQASEQKAAEKAAARNAAAAAAARGPSNGGAAATPNGAKAEH